MGGGAVRGCAERTVIVGLMTTSVSESVGGRRKGLKCGSDDELREETWVYL